MSGKYEVTLRTEPQGVCSFMVHAVVFSPLRGRRVVHLLLASDCDSCRCLETDHVVTGRGREDVLAKMVDYLGTDGALALKGAGW